MLTWETIHTLVEAGTGQVNPLLVGLVVDELDESIDNLRELRKARPLDETEDELLRGFVLKRYLLVKKLRDYFRVRDYNDYAVTEDEVIDATEPRASKRGMKKCSPDQRSSDKSKKAVS